MKHRLYLLGIAAAIAAGFGVFIYLDRPYSPRIPKQVDKVPAKPDPVAVVRKQLDGMAAARPAEAEKGYRSFIASHAASPDPKVQEEVGLARVRVGYLQARRRDFGGARETFLQTSASYKGTGQMSGDFGGVKDGAEYQAAVCLVAEGKKDEARQAFLDFLRKEPHSPLVNAAYRRLVRLNGGKSLAGDEKLLQQDLTAQQNQERLEVAMCGPRVLERLLPLVGKPRVGYQEIAKLCGTTDKGTTLEALREGLKHYGLSGYGAVVNRRDFALLPTPAIMSQDNHFVLILAIKPDYMEVFDPLHADKDSEVIQLPAPDDAEFKAMVLTLSPPHFDTQNADDYQNEDKPKPAPGPSSKPVPKPKAAVLMKSKERI